jgi:hypothetical protein
MLDLLLSDLDDIEVIREKENNIDILVKSKNDNFVLCIENKVWAGLSDDQLDKYYDYVKNKYSSYKQIFVLLSPSGYEVPGEKSKHIEEWVSYSYENIVKILRPISKSDIEQKTQYIIKDYIELLEKEHIVENLDLNDILAKLCTKHKEAIDLLLEYRNNIEESQSVIKHIQEIYVAALQKLENEGKIICNEKSLSKYFLEFYTTKMDRYFPPLKDESGSYQNGTKYKYFVNLKRSESYSQITLELGAFKQDNDTINKFNLIRKFVHKKELTTGNQYSQTENWKIDVDLSQFTLDNIDDQYIQEKILETLDKIFQWEIGLEQIINKDSESLNQRRVLQK